MRLTSALLAAALALPAHASPMKEKSFGVLLLCEGQSPQWSAAVAGVRARWKKAGVDVPLEEAVAADAKGMQKAVDRLRTQRVKKIVAVPAILSSHSALMDQLRYLFGIREKPAEDYYRAMALAPTEGKAVKRIVSGKIPVALALALDDHDFAAAMLAARARALSRDPSKDALVIAASPPLGDAANTQWTGTVQSLAKKANALAGFKSHHVFLLPDLPRKRSGEPPRLQKPAVDKTSKPADPDAELRQKTRELKRSGGVTVVALFLAPGDLSRRVARAVEGLGAAYDKGSLFFVSAKPGLKPKNPPRSVADDLSDWIMDSMTKTAPLPDMRTFVKEELPPPIKAPLTAPKL